MNNKDSSVLRRDYIANNLSTSIFAIWFHGNKWFEFLSSSPSSLHNKLRSLRVSTCTQQSQHDFLQFTKWVSSINDMIIHRFCWIFQEMGDGQCRRKEGNRATCNRERKLATKCVKASEINGPLGNVCRSRASKLNLCRERSSITLMNYVYSLQSARRQTMNSSSS